MKLRYKFIIAVFIVLVLCLSALFFKPHSPAQPNIIVITIDALRSDHLGCYGYDRDVSPNIDKLSKESFRFNTMTTPVPYTTPAIASMLTGLYPHRHGVRNFVSPAKSKVVFLQERLRNQGYRTAGFVGNWVLRNKKSGLAQGFTRYDDTMTDPELNREKIFERKAPALTQAVIQWLRKNHDKKFFLWAHYQDVHGPYIAPEEYMLYRHSKKDMVSVSLIPQYQRLPRVELDGLLTDANKYRDAYDAEIRFCDEYLGKVFDEVESLGLKDNTIIVVSADHGESLGEHDYYFNHGHNLNWPSIRIPLIMYIPKYPKGGVIESPVNLVDLSSTLLELIGYDKPVETEGQSLVPLLEDTQADAWDTPIFLEKSNDVKGIRTRSWKLLADFSENHYVLYNLKTDPEETRNALLDDPSKVLELKNILDRWMNDADFGMIQKLEDSKLSDEDVQVFRSLGYLQ